MQHLENPLFSMRICSSVLVYERSLLCSKLTQRSVTQPCVGQVLGDSFAELESLGMPEHFCEDELLFILNSDQKWEQHCAPHVTSHPNTRWPLQLLMFCWLSSACVYLSSSLPVLRKSLTLKYYAKKILYFLRQQNILRRFKTFLEQPVEQQSALGGEAYETCNVTFIIFY